MKLCWKIYLASLGLLLLSAAMLTAAISRHDASRSEARLRDEHRLLAILAASQVEAGYHEKMWPFEMLNAIAQEPAFASWRVVDGTGHVVLADHPVPSNSPEGDGERPITEKSLASPYWVAGSGAETEVCVVPMRMRTGKLPWTFRLEYSKRSVREHVWQIIFTNSLYAAGISILLLPISLFWTRHLLGPLTKLTKAVREMESGNRLVSLPPSGRDEIGLLISSFVRMTNTIDHERAELETRVRQRTLELRDVNQTLQKRVEERTSELLSARRPPRTPTAPRASSWPR